jgi:hypothetical protein
MVLEEPFLGFGKLYHCLLETVLLLIVPSHWGKIMQ